jgi:DNA invertase Pin-like site-specific DNA recombinase
MLEFCGMNHKAVAAVVVYDGTRFSRETMDALQVEAILNAKGIVVRSATQPFDETPEGGCSKPWSLLTPRTTTSGKPRRQSRV